MPYKQEIIDHIESFLNTQKELVSVLKEHDGVISSPVGLRDSNISEAHQKLFSAVELSEENNEFIQSVLTSVKESNQDVY